MDIRHSVLAAIGLFLLDGAFAQTYPSVDAYVAKTLGGLNRVEVLQQTRPSGLTVGAAYTTGPRLIETCCPRYTYSMGAKQGVAFVLRKRAQGQLELIASSPVFSLPMGHGGQRDGGWVSKVDASSDGQFSVAMQYAGNGHGDSMLFRFAHRGGEWVLAGFDRAAIASVGRRAPASGVVRRVSDNLLTGTREVRIYQVNPAETRMVLKDVFRTGKPPAHIPLSSFDPDPWTRVASN